MGSRHKIINFLFFFSFLLSTNIYSQLKVGNITNYTLLQNSIFHTKTKANLRTEAEVDSITPKVNIFLIQGNNPRCSSDNEVVIFSAVGTNIGSSPMFRWYLNDILTSTIGSSFGKSDFEHNDKIQCELISNLDCAKPKKVFSNRQNITISVTITSAVSINVVAGNNPDCRGNTPILLKATVTNGGKNPTYIWAKNNNIITTAVGSSLFLDSLGSKSTISVSVVSDIGGCAANGNQPVSQIFKRTVQSLISQPTSNAVLLSLLKVDNENCQSNNYTFSANALYPGITPIYEWYFNNNLVNRAVGDVFTNPGNVFKISMPRGGDELKVKVRSSLGCLDTKEAFSQSYFRTDTINVLPFFEDFSTYKGQPDTKKWIPKQGAYIANNYTFNPPSVGVAYFDGLKYDGNPYDSTSTTSRGVADRLTTLPINLSGYEPKDSLYLHFFWTVKGLGDEPDSTQGDRLSVLFKDENQVFIEKWFVRKYVDSNKTKFAHASVKISSTLGENFLHKSFQCRFQSTGRLTGIFDIWGVDYIYISNNSTFKRPFFNDQSFGSSPGRLLKNYTSMPYKHFIENISTELRDTMAATTINNMSDVGNVNQINFNLYENNGSVSIGNVQTVFTNFSLYPLGNKLNITKNTSIFPLEAPTNPYFINSTFDIRNDLDNSDGKKIPYTQNNINSYETRFDNYYAYDDGSAESIISRNLKFGHVAQKFSTNKTDTLRQIAVHWNRTKKALSNAPVSIMVWKNLHKLTNPNPKDPNILYKNTHLLKYANVVDGFAVIDLDTKENPLVIVNGDFHIGYQQITDEEVIVGFDKNNFYPDAHLFFSDNGQWRDFAATNPESKGSMMMRPVFGKYTNLPTFIENKPQNISNTIDIYPNPANDKVCVNAMEIEKISLFDIFGNNIITSQVENCMDIANVPNGIYFVKIHSKINTITKKIIVLHTK